MLKQISIFLFVLIISNGICQLSMSSPSSPTTSSSPDTPNTPTSTPSSPPLQDSSTTNTDDIVDGDNGSYNSSGQDIGGKWYAVMATPVSDDGSCNIFTNNKAPCKCIAAYFLSLGNNEWDIYMNAINTQTNQVTADEGGGSSKSSDNKDLSCFTLSRAEMSTCVIEQSKYTITDPVNGCANFMKYQLTVLGFSYETSYMITKIKLEKSGQEIIVCWTRMPMPGKEKTWTPIVKNLKELSIDTKDLSFIDQNKCIYPSLWQYDEMSFCQ